MTTKAYALFGLLAAALGLWGFWLGRASKPEPQMTQLAVPAPAVPAAIEPPAPTPVVEPAPPPPPPPAVKKKAKTTSGNVSTKIAEKPISGTVSTPPPVVETPPPAPAAPAPEPPKPIETAKVFKPEKPYEAAVPPKPREPHTATIPAGTLLTVRLREALNSERNSGGDTFAATLDQPLIIDGFVLAERGATARGHIVELARAGRVKGKALLALELKSLTTSDGQKLDLETDTFKRESESGVKKDAMKAGVMAGIGAAIGAIAGGGKGAAIGAGIGGATGAGTVLATRGEQAELAAETRLTFRLKNPITVTEKLD